MTSQLETRLVSLPLLVVIAAACVLLVLWLYRRDRRLVPRAWGATLVVLRIVLVGLLLVLVADPVLVRRERVREPGELVVIVDTSRSFSLKDPYRPAAQKAREAQALGLAPGEIDRLSRRDLAARALSGEWFGKLAGKYRITLAALDGTLRRLKAAPGAGEAFGLAEIPPAAGAQTRLDLPFKEPLTARPGAPIAGMLLWTDGNHHGPGDPREAAAKGSLPGVPLAIIGVGAERGPPDVAITAVDAEGRVFAGDDVEAQLTLNVSGIPVTELPLTISDDSAPVRKLVASLPGPGITRLPVTFPAGGPGRKKFTVSIPLQDGEVSQANNTYDIWIEVRDQKARLLYIDGGPRYEERYLRAAWSRDENVDFHGFLVEEEPVRRLPVDLPRKRAELNDYDVIVLGDVDPAIFTSAEVDLLRDFVTARGGTLVLICGERFLPYAWRDTALADIFPVTLLSPPPPAGAFAAAAAKGLPLTLTRAGEASEITRLTPGRERNLELWGLLPPPLWINPVAGVKPHSEILVKVQPEAASRLLGIRAAPADTGARKLLEARSTVFATISAGAGRVFYAGMDSTWKWRFRFGDELCARFWGQVVRWAVATRLEARDGNVRLGTDRLLYRATDAVRVQARIETAPGAPFEGEFVDAVIAHGGVGTDARTTRVRLKGVPRSGGRYEGSIPVEDLPGGVTTTGRAPAEYAVSLDIPDIEAYSAKPDRATSTFVVEPPRDVELLDLACNRKLLEDMAAAAGGRFLPLERFRDAAEDFRDASRETTRVTETRPIHAPWILAAILFGVLLAEWILRKRRDLV